MRVPHSGHGQGGGQRSTYTLPGQGLLLAVHPDRGGAALSAAIVAVAVGLAPMAPKLPATARTHT